jgi:pectinesterase
MSTSNFSIKVLLIPIVILLFSMQIGICAANTIYVDQSGSGDYITIEAGINAAYVGDVVKVLPGIYYESVRVNKKITLLGSGPHYTTINASKTTSDAVYMYSYGATISGFTLTSNQDGITIDNGVING